MSLRQKVLSLLRAEPRVYDAVHRVLRPFSKQDEIAAYLDEWSRTQAAVTFLQVGSNDGMANDPLREFAIRDGWRGVVIEPLPHLFKRLVRNYAPYPRITPEQCAVGYGMGAEATLYRLRAEAQERLPVWADQIASFDREHLRRHFPELPESEIEEVRVPVSTLEALAEKHGLGELSLLHLDVEGYEAALLQNLLAGSLRPRLILYERVHLEKEAAAKVEAGLTAAGYRVRAIGLDAVAVL